MPEEEPIEVDVDEEVLGAESIEEESVDDLIEDEAVIMPEGINPTDE